jgi:hypothetical protein
MCRPIENDRGCRADTGRCGNEDDAAPKQQPEASEHEEHSPRKCHRQPPSQHTPIVRPAPPFTQALRLELVPPEQPSDDGA